MRFFCCTFIYFAEEQLNKYKNGRRFFSCDCGSVVWQNSESSFLANVADVHVRFRSVFRIFANISGRALAIIINGFEPLIIQEVLLQKLIPWFLHYLLLQWVFRFGVECIASSATIQ